MSVQIPSVAQGLYAADFQNSVILLHNEYITVTFLISKSAIIRDD